MAGPGTPTGRFHDGFPAVLDGFELQTLERDAHVIYALSPDLALIYLNPAWFRFARDNGGEPAISERFGLGAPLAPVLPPPVRDYYLEAYRGVLEQGTAWHHDYECSSPERYRAYHQTVYAFRNGLGLLVINSLCDERPHAPDYRPPRAPDAERYRAKNTGLITQCCNCRRVQRPSAPEHWDWVPAWVAHMPPRTTSGLCHLCYEYYWKYRSA